MEVERQVLPLLEQVVRIFVVAQVFQLRIMQEPPHKLILVRAVAVAL